MHQTLWFFSNTPDPLAAFSIPTLILLSPRADCSFKFLSPPIYQLVSPFPNFLTVPDPTYFHAFHPRVVSVYSPCISDSGAVWQMK